LSNVSTDIFVGERVREMREASTMSRLLTTLRSYWTGTFQSRDPLLASELGYGPTSTGVSVTPESAFNSSAFWSAVSIIAADVASLPLELFKRSKDGSTSAFTDSKTYELVHDNPNPEMTSMVWRETLQAHALTWGGGYSEIERNGGGQPIALWPLTPDRVVPFRNAGRVQYRVANTNQPDTILEAYDILHVPGLGFNGLIGYSVLEKARESISMGLAMQRFGGSFFGNGSTFGGILSHPGKLTKEVKQGIRESIDAVHTGVDRAHKFVILGDGMTFAKLGIPPNDAQFLESRRFEIEEIARWFHMPQHKLNGLDHATFSNIEHLDLEYFKSCLRGWLVRWEQELNRKLVPSLERKTQYFKHNVEGFLRGDSAARADYQVKMFGIGGLSINQICELNDQNGIGPDGDARFVPANLMPVARALNPPAPPPPPVAPAAAGGWSGRRGEDTRRRSGASRHRGAR
jgi:HK97 family phage portal protein